MANDEPNPRWFNKGFMEGSPLRKADALSDKEIDHLDRRVLQTQGSLNDIPVAGGALLP